MFAIEEYLAKPVLTLCLEHNLALTLMVLTALVALQASMKERSKFADFAAILHIIGSLEQLIDAARCSAVCKTWRAACQELHPTSIIVAPEEYWAYTDLKPDGLVRVVKWFQLKARSGCLDSLQRLTVRVSEDHTTEACHQDRRLEQFSQSLSTLAGLWHLQSLELILHSPLDTAAALLPLTLRRLKLEVRTNDLPALVSLSMFEGVKGLEELDLEMWVETIGHTELAERQQISGFILNGELKALTSVKLLHWPVRMPADNTLSCYMPKLRHMNVFVNSPHAQSLIDLASLRTLTLNVLWFPEPGLNYQDRLEVSASSHLCFLFLTTECPANKVMTLLVHKANVQCCTQGVHAVATTGPLTNLGEESVWDWRSFHEFYPL